jgi:hypothetical protein
MAYVHTSGRKHKKPAALGAFREKNGGKGKKYEELNFLICTT